MKRTLKWLFWFGNLDKPQAEFLEYHWRNKERSVLDHDLPEEWVIEAVDWSDKIKITFIHNCLANLTLPSFIFTLVRTMSVTGWLNKGTRCAGCYRRLPYQFQMYFNLKYDYKTITYKWERS